MKSISELLDNSKPFQFIYLNIYYQIIPYISSQEKGESLGESLEESLEEYLQIYQRIKALEWESLDNMDLNEIKSLIAEFRELIAPKIKSRDGDISFDPDKSGPLIVLDKLYTVLFGSHNKKSFEDYKEYIVKYVHRAGYNYQQQFCDLDLILQQSLIWRTTIAELKDLPDLEKALRKELKIYLILDLVEIILQYL